jgi:hypothetical protein
MNGAMRMDHGGPGVGPNDGVLQAFEPYIEALAERLAERLERRRARMINQHESELGPRRHREAVKRRLDNGEGGAGRAGRNYLLTVEAIREELARKGGRGKAPPVPAGDGPAPPSGGTGAKSRGRELGDFERELMSGLRAVKDESR